METREENSMIQKRYLDGREESLKRRQKDLEEAWRDSCKGGKDEKKERGGEGVGGEGGIL